MHLAVLNLRAKSLVRGTVLVLASLVLALVWAGFPEDHATPKLIVPAIVALIGTWDTTRCLRLRWSFYHGGVMLLLYMDIMALAMIFFLLLYPYGEWLL